MNENIFSLNMGTKQLPGGEKKAVEAKDDRKKSWQKGEVTGSTIKNIAWNEGKKKGRRRHRRRRDSRKTLQGDQRGKGNISFAEPPNAEKRNKKRP